jgi:hypothetical protein
MLLMKLEFLVKTLVADYSRSSSNTPCDTHLKHVLLFKYRLSQYTSLDVKL